jgi:hypothetical protein
MRSPRWVFVVTGILLAGCGDQPAKTNQVQEKPKTDGMAGMQMGSDTAMGGMAMMSGMRAHMDSMAQASPEQLRSMMAMHEEMGSRMLDRMGWDMRGIT